MIADYPMCDYLRLSSFNAEDIAAFHRFVMVDDDLPKVPDNWLQYVGIRKAGRFAGVAEQSGRLHGVLDVSGESAHDALGLSVWFDVNCTRIDVQVTILIPPGYRARDFVDELREVDWVGRRRRVNLVESDEGLDTVYIGSRQSDRFIRVYVKQDEGGFRYLRFEVEYKEDRAVSAFGQLADRSRCGALLLAEVEALPAVFPLGDFRAVLLPYVSGALVTVPKHVSGSDSRYRWFVRTVVPFLENILNDHESGPRVRLALGELLQS